MKHGSIGLWTLVVLVIAILFSLLFGCSLPNTGYITKKVSEPEEVFVNNEDGTETKYTITREIRREVLEPPHAPCGIAITAWKIPLIGFGAWNEGGCPFGGYGGIPDAIVHNYYGVTPSPVPPGAFPLPPHFEPQTHEEKQAHGAYLRQILRSAGSDPREVSFRNETSDPLELMVGRTIFKLDPYGTTGVQTLEFGEHPVRLTFHRETFNPETGEMETFSLEKDSRPLVITPEDKSRSCVIRGESGRYSSYCRQLY